MTVETLSIRPNKFGARLRAALWPEYLTIVAYAAFVDFMIPYHEPWADEAQSWQLARSLPVVELFRHYLRYEGSPGLWHFLLAILSRLHLSYTGMHWFSAAVALVGTVVLVLCAPFPRYIRLALPFTFFLAYQYAVVARSYVLAPLILYALAIAWRRSPIWVALLLGLLGNLAMHCLAISAGFALVYFIELLRDRERVHQRKLLLAAILLAAFYVFALWTVLPRPPDLSRPWPFYSSFEVIPLYKRVLAYALRGTSSLIVPVASPVLLILLAVPALIYFAVKLHRAHIFFYALPILTFALFSGYYVSFWHTGLLVPTLITICWITWPTIRSLGKPSVVMAACCIALHIGWTIHAAAFDHAHAYSPDLATAKFLAPYIASGTPIALTYIGDMETNSYLSTGLIPYFDQPIFINQKRPFWLWSTREHTDDEFLEDLRQNPPIVVLVLHSNTQLFDPDRDLTHPWVALLDINNYALTHTFCGEKPIGFEQRDEVCHLIFEKIP